MTLSVAATTTATDNLALITIVTTVGMLIAKEVSSSLPGERARKLSQALNVAIIPLAFSFLATRAIHLFDALR